MDLTKMLDTVRIEETFYVWLTIHGNLCLALRHPMNSGPSRDYLIPFVDKLGRLLVEHGLLTAQELELAQRVEQSYAQDQEDASG